MPSRATDRLARVAFTTRRQPAEPQHLTDRTRAAVDETSRLLSVPALRQCRCRRCDLLAPTPKVSPARCKTFDSPKKNTNCALDLLTYPDFQIGLGQKCCHHRASHRAVPRPKEPSAPVTFGGSPPHPRRPSPQSPASPREAVEAVPAKLESLAASHRRTTTHPRATDRLHSHPLSPPGGQFGGQ